MNPANPASPKTPVQSNKDQDLKAPYAPPRPSWKSNGTQKSDGLPQKTLNFDFQPITFTDDNTIGKNVYVKVSKGGYYFYVNERNYRY